jgi:AmmeMemoRadiSam system protein A
MTDQDRKFMLELARQSVARAVSRQELPEAGDVSGTLAEKKACFVTLTRKGLLRGCLGQVRPQQPLYQAVINNACGAALRDPRFPPVRPDEVEHLKIEVSILSDPEPLSFTSPEDLLEKLQANRDGVLLEIGPRMATFLPQVWRTFPDKIQFLDHLAQKAGCDAGAWRQRGATVSVYRAESFEEP